MSMAGIRLAIFTSEANRVYGVMNAIALVYADIHWDDFRKEWEMSTGDNDEMHSEIREFIIHMLHDNPEALNVLLCAWGKEKTTEYVNGLVETHKKMHGEV